MGPIRSTEGDVYVDAVAILQEIAPESLSLVERRYQILTTIHALSPVGRRILAQSVGQSERSLRRELDRLKELGLVAANHHGVTLTSEGFRVLESLQVLIRDTHDIGSLERQLTDCLGLNRLIIVPGDSDKDSLVKTELAKAAKRHLVEVLQDGNVLAVSGGTTLSEVGEAFGSEGKGISRQVTVIPARGGLGEDVNIQANSVAAKLAQGLGGTYRLLHAPDTVDPSFLKTLLSEPRIRHLMALIRRADVLLHGIGTAEEMAKRRGLDEEQLMHLIAEGAVGEAFGYYFDPQGNIVFSTASVGLQLEDLAQIPKKIAVGGGRSKAWALLSVVSAGYCDVCITDEGAARRLMNLIKKKEETENGY